MKFIIQLVLTILPGYFLEHFFPWWSIALCAFFLSLIVRGSQFGSFMSGFTATGFLWMIKAATVDVQTSSILSKKIAPVFHLTHPTTLVILTGLVGGIVGGLSAWSGYHLQKLYSHKEEKYY